MPAARGDDMHGYTGVKQQRFMRTAQIVQAQAGKPESASPADECLGQAVWIAKLRE
jgi:hypothetical protein